MHRDLLLLLLLLLLLSASAIPSSSLRPEEHGVAHEKDPGAASPAMVDFFGGRPAVELPEATNATDPIWDLSGRPPPEKQAAGGGGRARVGLLAAGVACGGVGAVLLAAAGVAFAAHARRSKTAPPRRSCAEVRLGAA